ncbi:type VII secretion protein EccB [Streptomyces johnsoniae]|uniref:Type VII secretion protein EccB n=1 Tax=Streptomyces johnsoniae TaxID=3075532 RepID=A0ABU2RYV2_9ACTN|nr:type VII secretion protein EccB [Streptomyces sp. DSM 41886]MDT0441005.1 type VII secretion protein EccB [Streptomyces sp. DSM 41886]
MASRKDELNAYTFAKRRTVSAFLQPAPGVTEEGAPRPLRAVLPGAVVGALILAGFGAWGMFRPSVPENWDEPGRNVIIGSDSTTRYVVLETDGRAQLHPVLNLSSARLLLDDTDDLSIVNVDEDELDSGTIPRGPTLGIPYAPDRLPAADEVSDAKRWAVCQQPGGGSAVQQASFVLAERDTALVGGDERLAGRDALYVRGEDGTEYLIDGTGTKYPVGEPDPEARDTLLRLLTRGDAQPVTDEWLATFGEGDPLAFPELPVPAGTPAQVPGLAPEADAVGTVLVAPAGGSMQHYVVLPGVVVPVSDFTAHLTLNHPDTEVLHQNNRAMELGAQHFTPAPADERLERAWPDGVPQQVNGGDRTALCSVLLGVDGENGSTEVATWAGTSYPATIASGSANAYVTPGSGLLYRQVQGEQAEAGGVFLVTDTGLRYPVQATAPGEGEPDQAHLRLGYGDITPVPVPAVWSEFLPTGPRLDTRNAQQPQGS